MAVTAATFAVVAAVALGGSATATASTFASPQACCDSLATAFGPKLFPSSSAEYAASIKSYFTLQERITPTCVVAPTAAEDVARIVGLLANQSCQFAVRGGGHSLVLGAANIEDGVTVDLSAMKSVVLSDDRTTASIGPGCRWGDVYRTLDALGSAVPGGRAATVGVAGLTLGGGNSFFTARKGFVCDNVKNFEIVLGSGQIVNANRTSNEDLFRCLKGGSNNFGIVTRFDMEAFDQGDLWGGYITYEQASAPDQIAGFTEFADKIAQDPYASLIAVWNYVGGQKSISNVYEYTKPEAYPAIFENLTKIKPELLSTMRIASLYNITDELASGPDRRNSFDTCTFKNSATVMTGVTKIIDDALEANKNNPELSSLELWSFQFQPLPKLFSDISVSKGGNVLGLQDEPDTNVIFMFDLAWSDASQDAAFTATSKAVLRDINKYTKKQKAFVEFEYLPYSVIDANPLRSYGSNNLRKMRRVSREFDPNQVFQKLVPGGFKLDAAGHA